ncbi:MAG: aldo/keto reductase [Clostridia bacterium]
MRYFILAGIQFSKLVLGTDYFGDRIDTELAFQMMDAYVEHGGNTLDTARVYGVWTDAGLPYSEILIGLWLKSRGLRNELLLSTKGGHFPWGDPETPRLSRHCIETDIHESLKTLGTDHIDIYWLHRDDESRDVGDICESLSGLVKSGKTRLIGVSNWKHTRIEAYNAYASANGLPELAAAQTQWSLAYTTAELQGDTTQFFMSPSEYEWYRTAQFPVFGFSSQAKGFFTMGAQGLDRLSERARHRYLNPVNLQKLDRVKQLAMEKGVSVTSIVLAYITSNVVPGCAIFSSSSLAQLYDSMSGCDVSLTTAEADYLYYGQSEAGSI